jgi:hypothetical protein
MRKIALLAFAAFMIGCGSVANDQNDAGADASPEVADTTSPVPVDARLVSPLSTTTVRKNAPTLRWLNPTPGVTAEVQVCGDRACTKVVNDSSVAAESFSTALDPGTYFWRVRWNDVQSATWEFFVPPTPHGTVDTSRGTTLDLDGDGFAEVVLRVDSGLEVHVGSISGPVTASTATEIASTKNPPYLTSGGDLNGDGFPELVVRGTAASGVDAALIFYGSSSGIGSSKPAVLENPDTTPEAPESSSWFPWTIVPIGDMDADGYGDLVLTLPGAVGGFGRAYVYKGSKDGIAPHPSLTLGGHDGPSSRFGALAGAIDVDGDGHVELFVEQVNPPSVQVFRLPSTAPITEIADGGFVGDFNCDGYGDYYSTPPGQLEIFPGGPSGVGAPQTVSLPIGPHWANVAAVGDFNGDGCDDALVSDALSSKASLWTGDPSAWLVPGPSLGFTVGGDTSLLGDINGDGRQDVATRSDGEHFEGHLGDSSTGVLSSPVFTYAANSVASSETQ